MFTITRNGLDAISKDLGVISNNIANAGTNGFKRSRTEFVDFYSKALSDYKKEWSWAEMNGFLIKPSKWIKGNKMGVAGLKDEKDRASVMLYLNQNSDQPKELP